MINMIPHIVEHKHAESYELVVGTSCLDALSEKFQDFKIVVDYDSFESADEDIRNHGIWKANKRAWINTLDNAAEATRYGWGHGPAECYRIAICKAGFGTAWKSNPELEHSSKLSIHPPRNKPAYNA